MINRFPFRFSKWSNYRNRNICNHKYQKCKCIQNFLYVTTTNIFHSVIVVIASIKNIVKYKFNALCPSDNKIVDTLSLIVILTTIANILTIMLTHERTLAGVIFINISKAENLPFNVYLKSLLLYLPRTCK